MGMYNVDPTLAAFVFTLLEERLKQRDNAARLAAAREIKRKRDNPFYISLPRGWEFLTFEPLSKGEGRTDEI